MANQNCTREELLTICERAFLPQEAWSDRDTASAQRQLGECYALLKAGCAFTVRQDADPRILRAEVTFRGFDFFELGDEEADEFYLPTVERLDKMAGRDWYC